MPKFEPRPIYQTEEYFSHDFSTSEGSLRTSGTFSSSQNAIQIPQSPTTGSANHHEHSVNLIADNNRAMQTEGDSASSSACSAEIIISEENPSLGNNCDDLPGGQADLNATRKNPTSDANQES